jgi:hypothetical protein
MEREQQVSMCSQFDQVQDRVDEGNFHDHTFSALRQRAVNYSNSRAGVISKGKLKQRSAKSPGNCISATGL